VFMTTRNFIRHHTSLQFRQHVRARLHWAFFGLQLIRARLRTAKAIWSHRLPSELAFWDYWLSSHGATSPDDYLRRLKRNPVCTLAAD
jgi:hypothetical protein